jgi:hypothetical protein
MRRVYLRGGENVLKRGLIQVGAFDLSLVMRQLLGKGTPRGCQGYSADALLLVQRFWIAILERIAEQDTSLAHVHAVPLRNFHSTCAAECTTHFRHGLLGPSVTFTASAKMFTPCKIVCRESSPVMTSFAGI